MPPLSTDLYQCSGMKLHQSTISVIPPFTDSLVFCICFYHNTTHCALVPPLEQAVWPCICCVWWPSLALFLSIWFWCCLFYSVPSVFVCLPVCLALFCLSVYISAWIDILCSCIYLHDISLQCTLALVGMLNFNILWAIFKPVRDRSSFSHAVTLFEVFCFSDFSWRLFMLFKASKCVWINLKSLGPTLNIFNDVFCRVVRLSCNVSSPWPCNSPTISSNCTSFVLSYVSMAMIILVLILLSLQQSTVFGMLHFVMSSLLFSHLVYELLFLNYFPC